MVQRSSLYSTSITSASLGPGSALGEKGKKSAWAKKKRSASEESREVVWGGKRMAQTPFGSLRSPIFFLFDPIFCRAWSQASHHHKNETKGNEDESKEVQFPAAEMPLIK